jgi:hypothetical protein
MEAMVELILDVTGGLAYEPEHVYVGCTKGCEGTSQWHGFQFPNWKGYLPLLESFGKESLRRLLNGILQGCIMPEACLQEFLGAKTLDMLAPIKAELQILGVYSRFGALKSVRGLQLEIDEEALNRIYVNLRSSAGEDVEPRPYNKEKIAKEISGIGKKAVERLVSVSSDFYEYLDNSKMYFQAGVVQSVAMLVTNVEEALVLIGRVW